MNGRNKNEKRPAYRKPAWNNTHNKQPAALKLFDTADMMQIFKVTSRTLQRWRKEGKIPYKKIGGKIYYLADKLDELLKDDDSDE